MGLNGTIIMFPTNGTASNAPDTIARRAIEAFEQVGLLLPDTAGCCEPPTRWWGLRSEDVRKGSLTRDDIAFYSVPPFRRTDELRKLVHLMYEDKDGIELPCIAFSVLSRPLPIVNGYDGRIIGPTWATIEFSYEDVRFDESFHRILDENHPVFDVLDNVFSSRVGWDVEVG